MTSRPVALLLADLGIAKTHSRPHVSNDNPYSEAGFKTLKYRPDFPDRFGSIEDARAFCVDFFAWYNQQHRHSGIAMFTPADVHHGRAAALHAVAQHRPRRCLRRPPRALRQWPTPGRAGTQTRLDQRAEEGGAGSLNFACSCLTAVDRFRWLPSRS